jgi:radical SAM superfamily enzyme YgiQ (UPF0313 family)
VSGDPGIDPTYQIVPEGMRDIRISLGFPNVARIASGNLGFHIVHQMIAKCRGVLPETFCLPEMDLPLPRGSVTTRPGGLSLAATDLVLFSISYEGDAPHIPAMLVAGGLPAMARERRAGHPLVIAGGAMTMINPEPVAPFFDLLFIGEAEAMLIHLLEQWGDLRRASRKEQLAALRDVPGVIAPGCRRHRIWAPGTGRLVSADEVIIGGDEVAPEALSDADTPVLTVPWEQFSESTSAVRLPAGYEQGPEYLLELARGCPRRCRFCAASRIYAPLREAGAEALIERASREAKNGEAIGLLSLSAGDYKELEPLAAGLCGLGARLSISSLPPTFSRRDAAAHMIESGAGTLTIAPETGTDRLRSLAGKPLRNAAILESVSLLGEAGLRQLRTYFIVGLPGETDADIDGIAALLAQMRKALPGGCRLSATVNAFVPKPRTPFQWAAMAPQSVLRDRGRRLSRGAPKGVKLRIKSFREARLQALFSRGDIEWAKELKTMAETGNRFKPPLPAKRILSEIVCDSPLPWGYLLTNQIEKLKKEWREVRCQTSRQ